VCRRYTGHLADDYRPFTERVKTKKILAEKTEEIIFRFETAFDKRRPVC
jgi:hypothetical protein